jgi:Holliday junction resolvase
LSQKIVNNAVITKSIQKFQKKTEKKLKIKKNSNGKTQRTRRQRGYFWEDTLVKRFNALDGWKAFRLGSPSVALPDILVVNNEKSTIFTIEAKSGTVDRLPVPFDQVSRCLNWVDNFGIYKTRKVVLAFKFLSKKRIGLGKYEHRELREFYKVWDDSKNVIDCVCTYNGETYALKDGKRSDLILKDFQMPFKSKHRMLL